MTSDDREKDPAPERLTAEELHIVRGQQMWDVYFGKGWVRAVFVVGLPLVIGLLVIAGIGLSLIQPGETLIAYSQQAWVPGGAAAVRIAVVDENGEYLPVTELELELLDPVSGRSARLHGGKVDGAQAVGVSVRVPDWPDGRYELRIGARTTRSFKKATVNVRLDGRWIGEDPVVPRQIDLWQKSHDRSESMTPGWQIRVEIFPEAGQVASSLSNILYIRTTGKDGGPVAAEVDLELAEGQLATELPEKVVTDSLGLAAIAVHPTFNVLAIAVEARPVASEPAIPSTGKVELAVGPAGMRIRPVAPDPVVGRPVDLRVYSIAAPGPLLLDLYRDGLWIEAGGDMLEAQGQKIEGPQPGEPGLHVVQLYSSPVPAYWSEQTDGTRVLASSTIAHAHVWARAEGQSQAQVLALVAAELEHRGIEREWVGRIDPGAVAGRDVNTGLAIAFMLSRLDGAVHPPPVLATSRASDKRRADYMRGRLRKIVAATLASTGGLVAVALGLLTFRLLRPSRDATAAGDFVPAEPQGPLSRRDRFWTGRQVFKMLMLIAIILGMFGLIAMLISYLSWSIGT